MVTAFWQVIAAYTFAVAGGWISTSLQLAHKQLCALISLAAGTLLGVTIFAILPESFGVSSWWAVSLWRLIARPTVWLWAFRSKLLRWMSQDGRYSRRSAFTRFPKALRLAAF